MSLQVWLPLNGDYKNYGTSGLQPVQTTAPTYVNGKIGKAMSTGAFYLPAAEVSKFYNENTMSFAFWIYPTGSGSVTSQIIGQSSTSANGCRMFTIYQYPNMVDLHLSWQSETGGSTYFLSVIYSNAFTANAWNHCVITYDNPTCKVYINGALKQTYTAANTRTNFTYDVPIPNSSARYLNDLRIYDECLSPKQVKELSKALVVHYPLNDQYNSSVLNKYSGTYAEGNATTVEATLTKTKLVGERGYNFKGTYTGISGTSHYARLQWPTYTFTAGKIYFYSVKIRCHKWSSGSFMLRAARSSNDYGTGMTYVTVCQPTLADGQWHEYYVSQTINETYERGGSTVTCNPLFEFYSSNQSSADTVYEMDFDLKDVQVVESDTYIPFIKNEFASTTVLDTSGFMNNGTATGLTCTSDSPRYSSSSLFGSNRGIFCDKTTVPRVDGEPLTVSCWFKQLGRSGYQDIVSNRASSSFNWLLYTHTTDGSIQFHGANQNKSTVIPSLNAWHHVVAVVYTNSTYSLFLDGSKVVNAASYTYRVATSVGICIGKYGNLTTFTEPFDGYISDVRIYATALSDDDIKELYQTSASFDNLGNVHAYEISENL